MTRQEILEKIKKCLRLAKSDNANEAATAMRQAQKLMEQHNISEVDIALSDIQSSTTKTHAGNSKPYHQILLIDLICRAFGVDLVLKYREVDFIGINLQVEIATYAYEVVFRQLNRDRNAYLKSLNKRMKKKNKTTRADAFSKGWVAMVNQKVHDFANPPGTKELIEQFKSANYPALRSALVKSSKIKARDHEALIDGALAGEKVDLNHGMNGSQQMRLTT